MTNLQSTAHAVHRLRRSLRAVLWPTVVDRFSKKRGDKHMSNKAVVDIRLRPLC